MERPRCPHCQHFEVIPYSTMTWNIGLSAYIQPFRCKSCGDDYMLHLKPKEIHYEEKTDAVLHFYEEQKSDGL